MTINHHEQSQAAAYRLSLEPIGEPATIMAYFYDPTSGKARAMTARYVGVCRGCGAYTQPRNDKVTRTRTARPATLGGTVMVMSESSASALVRRFTEDVWNGRQLDLLDDLADDAYELRNLSDDSVPVRTRAELRAHIEEWLAAFPDLHMQETDHLVSGSRVVSVVRVTGTHTGEAFQGLRAAGASIDVALVAVFDSGEGCLTGHGTLLDARRLLQQLAP